jgi:hypothetical protein
MGSLLQSSSPAAASANRPSPVAVQSTVLAICEGNGPEAALGQYGELMESTLHEVAAPAVIHWQKIELFQSDLLYQCSV